MIAKMKWNLRKIVTIVALAVLICAGTGTADAGYFGEASYYHQVDNYYSDLALWYGLKRLLLLTEGYDVESYAYNAYYYMSISSTYAYDAYLNSLYGYVSSYTNDGYSAYVSSYYDYIYKYNAALYLYYSTWGCGSECSTYGNSAIDFIFYATYHDGNAAYYCGLASNGGID